MDEMLERFIEKRQEYEKQITEDLKDIENSLLNLAQVGDYFSIQTDELLITIKAIQRDDQKHIAIYTDQNPKEIPFCELSIIENPDLIMWIMQNDKLIYEGFKEVLINAVRNAENIINTIKALKPTH